MDTGKIQSTNKTKNISRIIKKKINVVEPQITSDILTDIPPFDKQKDIPKDIPVYTNEKQKDIKECIEAFMNDLDAGSEKSKNNFDYYNLTFDVIDTILEQHSKRELVNHQHESYKQFIEKDIGDIIKQFNTRKLYFFYDTNANKYKIELHIDFLNYNLGRPTIHENDGSFKVMRPDIAKLRNLTYSSPLTLNIKLTRILRTSSNPQIRINADGNEEIIETYDKEETKEEIFNNINFGRIPIMVMGSNCVLNKKDGTTLEMNGECPYDMGGYFIIGGNEKVIISQERIAENEPFVFNNQKKIKGKEIEIRCVNDNCFSVVVANTIRYVYRDDSLEMETPAFKAPVPIFIILKALGVKTDKQLFEYIAWDMDDEWGQFIVDKLKNSFERFKKVCKNNAIDTTAEIVKFQEIMINYLKFKNTNREIRLSQEDKVAYLHKVLEDDILPHIGTNYDKKAKYLGFMCRKLLLVQFNYIPHDDRDAYDNKRVDTPGRLLAIQFRQCFNKLVKDMVKSITREVKNNKARKDLFEIITNNNIYKIIKPTIIDGGLKYALATGNWGVKTTGKGNIKAGTAQVLNRLSYQSFISHLRRVNSPSDKTGNNGKIVKPRKLHGSSWGYLCPAETPEGQPVGLVKNMSLTAKITCSSNSATVRNILTTLPIKNIENATPSEISNSCAVFVNGDWIGITTEPQLVTAKLRSERRQANINIYTGIYWNILQRYIRINTDAGRLTRPMYIVDNDNKLRIDNEFVNKLKLTGYSFNFLINPKFSIGQQIGINQNIGINIGNGNGDGNGDGNGNGIVNAYGNEGVIEYIDTTEVNNVYYAMSINDLNKEQVPYINKFTHLEIFPGLILGAVAGIIPFPDDNQSPRNCYQCLLPDEVVLMANKTWKPLKDITLGEDVITFHPETFEISISPVINHFIRPALDNEPGFLIIMENGNTITATGNHKFITTNGWEQVQHMKPYQTKIGMMPNAIDMIGNIPRYGNVPGNGNVNFNLVTRIERVHMPVVADITVWSDNHSFIAGHAGFMSSNCAMGKQSMGLFAMNFQKRMDTLGFIMNNLERALVRTRFAKYINNDELPSGVNAMVAIGCYTGYNMEDSVLLNQGAIDRGLFRATFYRTYKDDEKKIQSSGREEKFAKPNPKYTRGTKPGNYNKLDERGFVRKDEYITSDDIIIGKVLPLKNKFDENGHQLYKDCSTSLRSNETGFVDKIYTDRNADGFRFVKIRMRTERIPIIGDKFASRCAQKGTVGMIFPQEHMPFNADGITPDIIMNPHAIPSRMTIGMLMEMILGKASAKLAGYSDCTPFMNVSYDKICEILENNGFNYTGDEILYSGINGTQLDVKIFFGPTYYQRLKHMVLDKQHSRASGPVVQLTRQPAEGRSRDGGLRFGEMEKDCFVHDTQISAPFGLSLKIQDFKLYSSKVKVLGWNKDKNGMESSQQTNFLNKGERECVDIYLEDGRKITCTPEHKLLTSNNEWINANELKPGDTRLKCSVKYPELDINKEMQLCNNWTLQINSTFSLKTNTIDEYMKTLAFSRLLGYLLTDGHIHKKETRAQIYMGHQIDLEIILNDIKLFAPVTQTHFKDETRNIFVVNVPYILISNILDLDGIMTGARVNQASTFPEFLLDKNCPLPIIREFLGGMFGGDGHTCCISKNTFTYIGFSKSKVIKHIDSLKTMMEQIKTWLALFDIKGVTIQNPRINTASKKRIDDITKNYEIVLHLNMNELIPFYEKIGFRYCCHKNQRLEAAVSYTRLRNNVLRQKTWIINRVNELTDYKNKKIANPSTIIPTKKAINQAIAELQLLEPIFHDFAIPNQKDILEYLINERKCGKIPCTKFPTSTEYLTSIDAINWFNTQNTKNTEELTDASEEVTDSSEERTITSKEVLDASEERTITSEEVTISSEEVTDASKKVTISSEEVTDVGEEVTNASEEVNCENTYKMLLNDYGVDKEYNVLPTMNLKVIDVRPAGKHQVYDIQVDKTESFLANGIVSHNCMIAHGAMGFLKERMMDVSDKFTVFICKECGLFSIVNPEEEDGERKCGGCDNYSEFMELHIPYACKLLMQELEGMMITPRFNQYKPNI